MPPFWSLEDLSNSAETDGSDGGFGSGDSQFFDAESEFPPDVTDIRAAIEPGDVVLDQQDARPAPDASSSTSGSDHLIIRKSQFTYPPSAYEGYEGPLPRCSETSALEALLSDSPSDPPDQDDFLEIELSDFVFYLPAHNHHHGLEMRGLESLSTYKHGHSAYLCDGILSFNGMSRYVERMPFSVCSIGNYGAAEHDSVDGQIWIQSYCNDKTNVYYLLKEPHHTYERFHHGFVWLADLSKHFVDYLEYVEDQGTDGKVSIHDFRHDFSAWLQNVHGASLTYQGWYQQYNHPDFRRAISANIGFLFKEAVGVDEAHRQHLIWHEIMDLDFIPVQKIKETNTIVTPYVYNCFRHLKSGKWLKAVQPIAQVDEQRHSVGEALHLSYGTGKAALEEPEIAHSIQTFDPKTIVVGDVVALEQDRAGVSKWKNEKSKWREADKYWYAYVQAIRKVRNNREFDVIWLYKPGDTTCAIMKYPWAKEMFFSDNCSCSTEVPLSEEDILFRCTVTWQSVSEYTDMFIRTTYAASDASFITFTDSHRKCVHHSDDIKTSLQDVVDEYVVGDTVLVEPSFSSYHALEPAQILEFIQQGVDGFVRLRRLPRIESLAKSQPEAFTNRSKPRPNELVFSDESFVVEAGNVHRKCLIRFYSVQQLENRQIPPPYNRDGTGDAFYITSRITEGEKITLQPISSLSAPELRQGFDPEVEGPRLRNMDLFCGGGTFGRGLEEGGAIINEWAVDLDTNALHTYNANLALKSVENHKLYLGSVDDFAMQFLTGNPLKSELIPSSDQVDSITAGNPCTGFSVLNSDKDNDQGLKNQSLVASVATYIDFYRPRYALLENVVTMASKGHGRSDDMLSQLICCLVGMGYQLQLFMLDAWSFGSAQSRSRLFVSITAPGLPMLPPPGLSHSHPPDTRNRGLGMCSNGLEFGRRRFELTPFEYVTASETTADLPDIGDGRAYCVPFPDHSQVIELKQSQKTKLELIPLHPRGMNMVKTEAAGLLTAHETRQLDRRTNKHGKPSQNWFPNSRAFERIHPGKLFPTITTGLAPQCRSGGRCLHWDQQRLMTVTEARRAQSYPDHEVLTGLPTRQYRIVGNSVARTVALALGLATREAWLQTEPKQNTASASHPSNYVLSSKGADVEVQVASSSSVGSKRKRPTEDDEISVPTKHRKVTGRLLPSASASASAPTSVSNSSSDSPPHPLPPPRAGVSRFVAVEIPIHRPTKDHEATPDALSPVIAAEPKDMVNNHSTPRPTVLNQKLQAIRDLDTQTTNTQSTNARAQAQASPTTSTTKTAIRTTRTNLQRFTAPPNPAAATPIPIRKTNPTSTNPRLSDVPAGIAGDLVFPKDSSPTHHGPRPTMTEGSVPAWTLISGVSSKAAAAAARARATAKHTSQSTISRGKQERDAIVIESDDEDERNERRLVVVNGSRQSAAFASTATTTTTNTTASTTSSTSSKTSKSNNTNTNPNPSSGKLDKEEQHAHESLDRHRINMIRGGLAGSNLLLPIGNDPFAPYAATADFSNGGRGGGGVKSKRRRR